MNVFDKILVCLFLLAIIVWQALHQAKLFKQNKTISHLWKAMWYAGAVALVTIPYVWLYNWWYLLKIPILGVLERVAFFDLILNKFRNYVWWYNGSLTSNLDQKQSLVDRIENNLPAKWLKVLKISYLIFFILAIIFIK